MSRLPFFQPRSIRFSPANSRSVSLCLSVSLASFVLGGAGRARADEFSVLPPNDPIAVQLAVLAPAAVSTSPASTVPVSASTASLTRYEAALQTARVILSVQNRAAGTGAETVTRAQWRAIAALCGSLKNELRQLGIDVEAARALAAKNLRDEAPAATPAATGTGTALKNAPLGAREAANGETFERSSRTAMAARGGARGAERGASILTPELVASSSAGGLGGVGNGSAALEVKPLPGLRVATGLPAARTGANVRQNESRFAPGPPLQIAEGAQAEVSASQTALSYDLGRYLTLRAANSRLNWNGVGGAAESPLLGAPIFAGASGASGTGGGVDLNLGAGLRFSTEIERLRADNGTLASRIGGGASLSAFQDRLLLNMSLSRLLPIDRGALTTTAAEVGASLDLSSRLSLNLRYQGLFAPLPNTSAARVAGGVSLSF